MTNDSHAQVVELGVIRLASEEFAALKGDATVSVCLPCHNEQRTIGAIVEQLLGDVGPLGGVLDELIVVDDRSTDSTAAKAEAAGARVVSVDDFDDTRAHRGKGNALLATARASRGDVLVWLDGDLRHTSGRWIIDLAAPLLQEPSLQLVKASFNRPADAGGQGGGRTTELVARPLLAMFFPELTRVHQPLVGELAVRRSLLRTTGLDSGWGVEIALLIDTLRLHGPDAIGQVDLGVRHHRHRPVRQLTRQAAEIIATVLIRAGVCDEAALQANWLAGAGEQPPLNLGHAGG